MSVEIFITVHTFDIFFKEWISLQLEGRLKDGIYYINPFGF